LSLCPKTKSYANIKINKTKSQIDMIISNTVWLHIEK